jgi:hypothetical protein
MVFFTSKVICHSAGRSSVFILLSLLILLGCSKEEVEHYAEVPEIRLLDLSQDTIRQYEDVLVIRISYKDGDGDVGFEDPEQYALFVRDIRLEDFDGFYVGPLAPPDANVPIQGELTIEFPSLFLFGNGAVEQTRFQIKMIDRAGNESNLLETGTVAITRE